MEQLNFLQELIARWKAKQPNLFKWVTTISAILTFITGVPELLMEFGIALPEWALPFSNKVIAVASLAVSIISKLTVATPVATEKVLEDINSGATPKNAVAGK